MAALNDINNYETEEDEVRAPIRSYTTQLVPDYNHHDIIADIGLEEDDDIREIRLKSLQSASDDSRIRELNKKAEKLEISARIERQVREKEKRIATEKYESLRMQKENEQKINGIEARNKDLRKLINDVQRISLVENNKENKDKLKSFVNELEEYVQFGEKYISKSYFDFLIQLNPKRFTAKNLLIPFDNIISEVGSEDEEEEEEEIEYDSDE
jgi:hypothetical protein